MKKEYDFSKGKRGALEPIPSGKTRITIRLDNEIIEWFRNVVEEKGGGNYQTMINNSLRECIANRGETLEETFRRVFREEMPSMIYQVSIMLNPPETAVNRDIRTDISFELDSFSDTLVPGRLGIHQFLKSLTT